MHIEKIHFEKIFDAVERFGDFSFASRNRVEYGARLDNKVIPREGSSYAIAFAEPGDWSTVLGWRDLASADVRLKLPLWHFWLDKLTDFALFGPFFIVGGLLLGGGVGALAVTLALVFLLSFQARRVMRINRSVKQALSAAVSESDGAPAG